MDVKEQERKKRQQPIPGIRLPRDYAQFLRDNNPSEILRKGTLFFVAMGDDRNYVYAFVAQQPQAVPAGFGKKVIPIIELLEGQSYSEEKIILDVPDLKYSLLPKETDESYHVDIDLDFLQWLLRRGWDSEEAAIVISVHGDVENYSDLFLAILAYKLQSIHGTKRNGKEITPENAKSSHWREAAKSVLKNLRDTEVMPYPVYWYDDGLIVPYTMPKAGKEYPEPIIKSKKEQVGELYAVAIALLYDYETLYYSLKPEIATRNPDSLSLHINPTIQVKNNRNNNPTTAENSVSAAAAAAASSTISTSTSRTPLGKSRPSTQPSI